MPKNIHLSTAAWASLSFLLGGANAAYAQDFGPPPVRSIVDANGVDLLDGSLNIPTPAVSIGQGAGGLGYQRYYDTAAAAWRDNMAGVINDDGAGLYTVTLLGSSVQFTESSGVFTEVEARGASLTFDSGTNKYTFTSASGDVAVYDKALQYGIGLEASQGRVITLTQPDGRVTNFTYVTIDNGVMLIHRLQSVNNTRGYQLKFEYATDTASYDAIRLTKVTALNNSVDFCNATANGCSALTQSWPTLTFTTSTSGSTTTETVTDSLSGETKFIFTTAGLTGYRRPTSPSTNNLTYTYNNGAVASVSNGTNTWSYAYSISGDTRTTTMTDPLTHQRVVTSSISDNVVLSDRNGLNKTTTFEYDTSNRLKKVIYPEGNYSQLTYDTRGNVTEMRQVAKSGSGLSDIVTTATFPSTCDNPRTCNLPTAITDALSNTTNFTYNATHGGILTVTSPAIGGVSPETRFTYTTVNASYKTSAGGSLQTGPAQTVLSYTSACATTSSCSGGSNEVRTDVGYTSSNNLLPTYIQSGSGNGALVAGVSITYDTLGNTLTTDGPLSGTADTVRYRYDANRQLIGVVGPDPDGGGSLKHRAMRYTYNGDGQTTATEQGTVNSQSDSDWASFASLAKFETSFNSIGLRTRESFIANSATHAVTQYSYTAVDMLECAAIRLNPAEFGALPSACTLSPTGDYGPDRITKIIYDAADQVAEVKEAFGTALVQTAITLTYTNNGLQATLADARGSLTTFEYDGFDRLRRFRYPNATTNTTSSTTDYEQYTYDAGSNVTQVQRRSGSTLDFTYDALNRITFVNSATASEDITTTYDNLSRVLTRIGDGQTLTNTWDALGRLVIEQGPLGYTSYQYNLAGQRTRMTWPDSFYVTYDLDNLGEVTAIKESGSTSLVTYAYDNLGRRVTKTLGNGNVTSWTYDNALRMATMSRDFNGTGSDQTTAFVWNAAGQQVSQSVTNASLLAPAPSAATTSYTPNGLNQYATVGGVGFTYDTNGNLINDGVKTYTYDIYNQLKSATGAGTFGYDPAGRLYYNIVGAASTTFSYDGIEIAAEYDGTGTLQRRYVRGPDWDETVVWYEGSGTSDRRYLSTDERGSIVTVANSSGATINDNTFDEYGRPGASNIGRFQYTGQAWLPAVGAYHYKARTYSPTLGRFLQTDPIGFAGGSNFYAYVGNDPLNWIDSLGLDGERDEREIEVTRSRYPRQFILSGIPHGWFGGVNLSSTADPTTPGGIAIVVTGICDSRCQTARMDAYYRSGKSSELFMEGGRYIAEGVIYELSGLWLLKGTGWVLGRLAASCGCFVEGTLVATPDGLRPIEDIDVGDKVLGWHPETGATAPETVTALIRPGPKEIWHLQARDANGEIETFDVTDDHPWFIEGAGWVETQNLRAGQHIETADDRGLLILRVTRTTRVERTYNLTVSGPHTFLVGEDGAVVHNCSWLGKIYGDLSNKLSHVFRPKHNLGPLVGKYGSEEAAFAAIHRSAQSLATRQGVVTATIDVGGTQVVVRGTSVNGVFRVGSAWIPGP